MNVPEIRREAKAPDRWRTWLAWGVALTADAIQLALFPLFGEGFASPLNDALDVCVAVTLIATLGFHWVLLPTILMEGLPMVDLAPTWTIAVGIILKSRPALPQQPVGESGLER